MHVGQSALDAGERGHVRAGLAAVIDALGQRLDLDLERLHRAAGQRFGQRTADFGKVGAKAGNRGFDFLARPQSLDARRDFTQLPF